MGLIATLLDRSPVPQAPLLTAALFSLYGSDLAFPKCADRPYVFGNFVTTLDGVASYKIRGQSGGGEISGFDEADQFIMGLLRSYADAVVFGSGTLHEDSGHVRIPEFIYPPAKDLYLAFRQKVLKKPNHPLNVVITGSGKINLVEPTFHTPELRTLIITTKDGRNRLERDHGDALSLTEVRAISEGNTVSPAAILELLYEEFGVRLLLHEGGPTLFGEFLTAGLVDELFLTLAPQVAGRTAAIPRPGFAERSAFLPQAAPWFELVSLKVAQDDLFLRFAWKGQRQ